MYYYVYRITNIVSDKHYYGKRTSKVLPKEDLGVKYFSSSKDAEFMLDQKNNPKNYKYKVICVYKSNKKALLGEIKLHTKFDVGKNPNFYNKARQISTGFDTTGIVFSEEQRERCRNNSLGRKHTPEAKEKNRLSKLGNSWNKGRKHTPEAIEKMKNKAKKGVNHPNAKLVNIYEFSTDKLIAEAVVLSEWCKSDKSLRANLAMTLRVDRSKPSSRYNPWQSKGYYAKYTNA